MRTRSYLLVSVITVVAAAFANGACSSPTPALATGDDDQTGANPTTPSTPAGNSTPSAPSDPSTPPAPAVDASAPPPVVDSGVLPDGSVPPVQTDCSTTTTADTCYQCCDGNSPPGTQIAEDAWMACICTAPGVCAQQCGSTLCSPGGADPNSSCQRCLDSNAASQCDNVAQTACNANPSCMVADQCAQTNNCDNKQ